MLSVNLKLHLNYHKDCNMFWNKVRATKAARVFDNNPPTKLIVKFQQRRDERPNSIVSNSGAAFETGKRESGKRELLCPQCDRPNFIEHGDRLQCGCGHLLELYGNGYYCWNPALAYIDHGNDYDFEYEYGDVTFEKPVTIMDKLTAHTDIADIAKDHPAITDALDEIAVLIKLHENIDKGT